MEPKNKSTLLPTGEKGEIVLYQPDESIRLEVRLEDETVISKRYGKRIMYRHQTGI